MESVNAPAQAVSGQPFTVTWSVTNNGDADATGAWYTRSKNAVTPAVRVVGGRTLDIAPRRLRSAAGRARTQHADSRS